MANSITIRGLEMHFRGCDALQGVDLEVPEGSVFALLGENGAGKTTLIRVLTGFLQPSQGSAEVLGLDPVTDALEVRRRIGYVADSPALYDWMRVDEIGWFTSSFYDESFLGNYRDLIARFDVPTTRKIRHLSKGQRAKVALALAIAHDPELLVLDEPTSGLDPLVRRDFLESMVDRAATGRTVLLSSHQIAEVERVADYVAILAHGRIRLVDTLSNLKEKTRMLTITLADPLIALPDPEPPVEILSTQQDGRQHRWVVRNFDPSLVTEFESKSGVLAVQEDTVTLDELFVACVHHKLPEVASEVASNRPSSDRQAS